jgi:GxxExxY protein
MRPRKREEDPRTYAIIGAAMEVHRQLGCGFLEAVYQEAMALELAARDIPHKREVELPIFYKGDRLNTAYRALCLLRGRDCRTQGADQTERN